MGMGTTPSITFRPSLFFIPPLPPHHSSREKPTAEEACHRLTALQEGRRGQAVVGVRGREGWGNIEEESIGGSYWTGERWDKQERRK